jgi:hypothetical protein
MLKSKTTSKSKKEYIIFNIFTLVLFVLMFQFGIITVVHN